MSAIGDGDFPGTRAPFEASASPFDRIAIVGLGLMGGSAALAIRACWPAATLIGIDRADVIEQALAQRVIDLGATDPAAAVAQDAALVLLAAPVLQNLACLDAIAAAASAAAAAASAVSARAEWSVDQSGVDAQGSPFTAPAPLPAAPLVISDLGSTKQAIVDAARALPASLLFIGGHPMAGAAQAGLAAARSDLFHGRPWIFTPDTPSAAATASASAAPSSAASSSAADRAAALDRLERFVRGLGAQPLVMDAAEHDRVMAYVSHLPQLVASGLMRTIGEHVGAAGLAVSGPGLADSTRLASSPASVWTEICQTNAAALGFALDALIADLQAVRQALTTPNALAAWLEAGARWRAQVPNGGHHTGHPGGASPQAGRRADERADSP